MEGKDLFIKETRKQEGGRRKRKAEEMLSSPHCCSVTVPEGSILGCPWLCPFNSGDPYEKETEVDAQKKL